MDFIRCTEELPYVLQLPVIMVRYVNLRDEELTTHGLNYAALLCPFARHYLINSFDFLLKATLFERRLRLKPVDPLLVNWHFFHFFDILPVRHCELFVNLSMWWDND